MFRNFGRLVLFVGYFCIKAIAMESAIADSCSKEKGKHLVRSNGVDLCIETFGKPENPALLFVMGAGSSMVWFEDELCHRLRALGLYVIRYDHRDTGHSVHYKPGKPEYSLEDLAEDAVGVLDALQIKRAHILGASMGGMIAQLVGLNHPDRVSTLTLVSSSPQHGSGKSDLPATSEILVEPLFTKAQTIDWSDRKAVIDYMVVARRLIAGTSHPFDEKNIRALAELEFDRSDSMASTMNHLLIRSNPWRSKLREIKKPTLVIHGTADPVLPYGHGVALAKEIPGAVLVPLKETGHEFPRGDWDVFVDAIDALIKKKSVTQLPGLKSAGQPIET